MFGSKPVLIVEDEFIIAMALADAVAECDGTVVGPFATVSETLAALDQVMIAAAILDARLTDRDITPVALRLAREGIPLVVHSGTGLPPEVASEWPDLPVFLKPGDAQDVVQRLLIEFRKLA